MTFESRIRNQLRAELDSVPTASGHLDRVLARGSRRRVSHRVAQTVAVAAALVLAVASTALVVKLLAGPDVIESPTTGRELRVINEDPVVLQGMPGPLPEEVPDGIEVRFDPIEGLVGTELDQVSALSSRSIHDVIAVGEVRGWRAFATPGVRLDLTITDEVGRPVLVRASGGLNQGMVVGLAQGSFVVAQTDPNVETVTLVVGDEVFWQRPVEGVVVIPLAEFDENDTLRLVDDKGTVLLEQSPTAGT